MIWLDSRRLRSASAQTRRKAIERLTNEANLRSLRMLVASLGDQDPQVRCAAAKALNTITQELSVASRVAALTHADGVASAGVAVARNGAGDGRHPHQRAKTHDADPSVALAACSAIANVPAELLDKLAASEPRDRLAAAQSLEENAQPGHLTVFLTLLADDHPEVRVTAVRALRRIGDPTVAQALVARLADTDSDVRAAAASALGTLRAPAAIETLVVSLADEEPAVRHAAAAALEQVDPRWVRAVAAQRAVPRLEHLRDDPRSWVVMAAEKVLLKLATAKGKDTEVWKRESGIREL
jgi:HEAT repeat protein